MVSVQISVKILRCLLTVCTPKIPLVSPIPKSSQLGQLKSTQANTQRASRHTYARQQRCTIYFSLRSTCIDRENAEYKVTGHYIDPRQMKSAKSSEMQKWAQRSACAFFMWKHQVQPQVFGGAMYTGERGGPQFAASLPQQPSGSFFAPAEEEPYAVLRLGTAAATDVDEIRAAFYGGLMDISVRNRWTEKFLYSVADGQELPKACRRHPKLREDVWQHPEIKRLCDAFARRMNQQLKQDLTAKEWMAKDFRDQSPRGWKGA